MQRHDVNIDGEEKQAEQVRPDGKPRLIDKVDKQKRDRRQELAFAAVADKKQDQHRDRNDSDLHLRESFHAPGLENIVDQYLKQPFMIVPEFSGGHNVENIGLGDVSGKSDVFSDAKMQPQ